MTMEYRTLGKTDFKISTIGLGCWPIAGVTSPGATEENSLATIRACFDLGINHLDTAHFYGPAGESERLIGRALGDRRDEMIIATKGGIHWGPDGKMAQDARPETLRQQCETSLERLGTDRVELLYLHAPDENVPVAESAGALRALLDEGKTRSVGFSNATLEQIVEFAAECPLTVYQPPYNMLQREIETDVLPWCRRNGVAVLVYWPLLKGLLAGKLGRDHVFAESDSRRKYAMFRGDEWQKNQDLIDRLRQIANSAGHTVAELVINWTIHQPSITAALCGAKHPAQIIETAAASGWELSQEQQAAINQALADRGKPQTENPV
jgi:aryl-alcohol dehydrogenase-like predicted oxidoreductase